MKNYIKRYLLVLGNKKKQIPLIFIFFLLASLLDLFGLSLVAPLIYSIISPENLHTQFNYSFIPDSSSDILNRIIFSLIPSYLMLGLMVSITIVNTPNLFDLPIILFSFHLLLT